MSADPKYHITAIGSDAFSGMYRFTIPIRTLIENGTATGNVYIGFTQNLEIVPGSTLLTQRQLTLSPPIMTVVKQNHCRVVHDIDDHPWLLQSNNQSAPKLTPAMMDVIDRKLACADAVTVSTEPLAATLRKRGHYASVLANVIDPSDWTVQPRRADRTRPRIGWYGQCSVHGEDLALIDCVVRTLIDEADFVFFGKIPGALANVADRVERCLPAPLSFFPAMLAALDLDIMLAPLANNEFNECKTNLPLLHAGMLGYPTIASDVEPYRTLPVTHLRNTPELWIAAIRDSAHDTTAARVQGEDLRRAVHSSFLAENWAQRYLELWTGNGVLSVHA